MIFAFESEKILPHGCSEAHIVLSDGGLLHFVRNDVPDIVIATPGNRGESNLFS